MIHKKANGNSSRSLQPNSSLSGRNSDAASGLRRESVSTLGSGSTSATEYDSSSESQIDTLGIELSLRNHGGDTKRAAEDVENAVSVIEQSGAASSQEGTGWTNAVALGSLFSFGGGAMIGMPFTMLLLKDMASQAAAIFSSGVIGVAAGGVVMSALYQRSLNSSASAQSPA